MTEARKKLIETSGCPDGCTQLEAAIKNICAAWETFLNAKEITIDRDVPIDAKKILLDPSHPVTVVLLHLYSLETFLYRTRNHAYRFGDLSKVHTLGPYSQAFHYIVADAGNKRKDIKAKEMASVDLYRGCNMTPE